MANNWPVDWPVVVVEWEDAWLAPGEGTVDELAEYKPAVRRSVGFLVREDEGHLFLAGCDDRAAERDNEYDELVVLPRGMVRRVDRYERMGIHRKPLEDPDRLTGQSSMNNSHYLQNVDYLGAAGYDGPSTSQPKIAPYDDDSLT